MARWGGVGKADVVHVIGTEEGALLKPPVSATGKAAAGKRVAAHRYRNTRGNRAVEGLFGNTHGASTVHANSAATTVYLGGGIVHVSGVGVGPTDPHFGPNCVGGNAFATTGPQGELGVPVLGGVHAGGFGGPLSIANNAIFGITNGGLTLCTWWGSTQPTRMCPTSCMVVGLPPNWVVVATTLPTQQPMCI